MLPSLSARTARVSMRLAPATLLSGATGRSTAIRLLRLLRVRGWQTICTFSERDRGRERRSLEGMISMNDDASSHEADVEDEGAASSGFSAFALNDELLKAVDAAGYEEPTPVQRETIPLFLDGRDLIVQAQTGTGKTAAFALPILECLKQDGKMPQ